MKIFSATYPGTETITEELRASHVGDGLFVIESVPFVDTTVALGDIVECVLVNSRWHINRVVTRGGNSTLRIYAEHTDVTGPLLALGVHVEHGPGGLLAVSISPTDPIEGIMAWLEPLHEQGLIDLAFGHQSS